MRQFELGESFGLVIIPFRSFLHLLSSADQIACLHAYSNDLVDNGRFALNIFTPDPRLTALAKRDFDPGSFISRVERRMKLRHVTREEMEHLYVFGGFEEEALYGWFDRLLDDESSEMVWVACKARQRIRTDNGVLPCHRRRRNLSYSRRLATAVSDQRRRIHFTLRHPLSIST